MSRRLLALSVLPALWLAGCADPAKAPAQAALVEADAALLGLAPEVERLAPEEVRAVRVAREVALAAAGRKDWKGALGVALTVRAKADVAVEAARARKQALARAWAQARVDVPNLLYALEDRLDELADTRRLPAGLDRPALAAARTELEATRSEWEQVAPLGEGADPAAGIARAEGLRARVVTVLDKVGLR
jgi:hypothetical protein